MNDEAACDSRYTFLHSYILALENILYYIFSHNNTQPLKECNGDVPYTKRTEHIVPVRAGGHEPF